MSSIVSRCVRLAGAEREANSVSGRPALFIPGVAPPGLTAPRNGPGGTARGSDSGLWAVPDLGAEAFSPVGADSGLWMVNWAATRGGR